MKIYNVDAEEYFSKFPIKVNGYCIDIVKDSMNQLINRFNLQNKKVLSIGSGLGFEEYWFYNAGCQLTLVDKKYNNPLKQTKESLTPTLTYILGDIFDVIKQFEEKYDLVYTSGLHETLLWIKEGFSELIYKCIELFIETGLFICQSYHGGLKMNDPQSIEKIKKQCERENVHLVSIYYFFPSHPRVSLITIFKGSETVFIEYLETIKNNKEIERFHGRSNVQTKIKKVYQHE